jgi:glucose/arabinose dehydrogenase
MRRAMVSTARRIAFFVATMFIAMGAAAQQGQPDIGIAPLALTQSSYTFDTAEVHKIRVTVVAKGLPHPFAFAFLPSGDALIAERGMQLRIVRNALGTSGQAPVLDPEPVPGMPQIVPPYRGGGLHDIALHPKFAENKLLYFTYNKAGEADPKAPSARRPSAISLWRGRFDGKGLVKVEELFVGEFGGGSGSRIAFGKDGCIYMTTGAPGPGELAQNANSVYGKVLRLNEDGSVPKDNPFVGREGARPEVFTLGHRDQLGIAVHPGNGAVLTAEHGPNGGDEVNVILPGRNYGWPKWSFGRNYNGPRISASPFVEGIEQPLLVWLPSIAPTGMSFYSGDRLAAWKGNLFVGSARRGEVPRTGGLERIVFNDTLEELRRETLLTELHQRIRDVRQGPDGLLYVLTDEDDGALLRIEPSP